MRYIMITKLITLFFFDDRGIPYLCLKNSLFINWDFFVSRFKTPSGLKDQTHACRAKRETRCAIPTSPGPVKPSGF